MTWYYHQLSHHTFIRVFMHVAFCGKLTFRNDEFEQIKDEALRSSPTSPIHAFIPDFDIP